jgi:imidazolonepropionase
MASILIRNIKALGGVRNKELRMVKGNAMKEFPVIENAYLLIEEGLIKAFGNNEEAPERAGQLIDASERYVLPCWCDSHTHIVYAGTRENEFVDRIKGLNYETIAKNGGGILNSAKQMVSASEDELFETAWGRLEEMEKYGTGAVEIKSGYGLSYPGEMKMLRVIRKLKEKSKLTIKATFLGAHAYPAVYKEDHQSYIDLLTQRMIPEIAAEGLADFIDVFCDRGFYSATETDVILQAGAKYGLRAKIHANELDYSGGIEAGVKNKALSVDHLEFTGGEQIKVLLNSETMPTLLPSTAFFLGLQYAPARKMMQAGLPIALASDFNPGSSPSGNMQIVVSLACIQMKMLPEEALNAATLNSAYAMEVDENLGSIGIGKKAHIIITKPMSSLAFLPYSFGSNCVEQVIIS